MAEEIKFGAQAIAAGRANFPTSPECGQWETLLADALDGLLRPEDEGTFSSHMGACAYCSELFEQARRGREWLEFLAPEPEVPAQLLEKILAGTGHGKPGEGKLAVAGGQAASDNLLTMRRDRTPAWQRPGLAGRMRRFAEPRLLMTAAMAFFSIALTLSMTGVRFSAIRMADLRPAALRSAVEKRIMTASTPIVRYYDHLRFVYEVESTVRELKRSTENQQTPDAAPNGGQTSQPGGESHRKDGGSRLIPQGNPNEAPQQTGNPAGSPAGNPHVAPSLPLWSGEMEQARLEVPVRGRNAGLKDGASNEIGWNGTGLNETGLKGNGALAEPERRTSWLLA